MVAYAQQTADTSSFAGRKLLPEVEINGFKVLNTDLPIDSLRRLEKIELTHNQNSFSISFGTSNTIADQPFTYLYKLEGADKKWMQTPTAGYVNYTLLPPGTYRFKVMTSHSQALQEMVIVITLPFWLRTPFIILGSVLFIALIYSFHRIHIRRILAVETMRQKVARDLHDDIGSTLSTITILSVIAKSKLAEDPAKAGEYLSKINDNSVRMMEVMDDIVWSINPMNDSMNRIVARMRQFASEALESNNVQTEFYFDETVNALHLDMEKRRDLFLLFKEAINNIAKHANASHVKISLTFRSNVLKLTVADNGSGFDAAKAGTGNGLHNMQKRADNLKAQLSISSGMQPGTVLTLEMKLT